MSLSLLEMHTAPSALIDLSEGQTRHSVILGLMGLCLALTGAKSDTQWIRILAEGERVLELSSAMCTSLTNKNKSSSHEHQK